MTDDIDEFMRKFKERVDSRPTIPIPPKDTAVKVTTVHFPSFIKKKEPFEPAKILPIILCGCGDPSLEYRSASGSKSKCGFAGFIDTNKRYLNKETTESASWNDVANFEPNGACPGGHSVTRTLSFESTTTQAYDAETCVLGTAVCEGSGSQVSGFSDCGTGSSTSLDCSYTFSGFFSSIFTVGCVAGANPGTSTVVDTEQTVKITTTTLAFGCSGSDYDVTIDRERITTITLTNEYTTALLKSNTTDFAEDDYTEWGDGDTSSYANLSVSELNYSATESQVRILHEGSCYLKVWLRTAFTPDGGGAVQYADLATYEFTAATEGDHESPAYTNTVPDENGTKTVEMKFICTEGEDEPAWP